MRALWGTTDDVKRSFLVAAKKKRRTSLQPSDAASPVSVEAEGAHLVVPLMAQQLMAGDDLWFCTGRMKHVHRKAQRAGEAAVSPASNTQRTIDCFGYFLYSLNCLNKFLAAVSGSDAAGRDSQLAWKKSRLGELRLP